MRRVMPTLVLIVSLVAYPCLQKAEAQESVKRSQIEVCFVLDSTGSMGGLIEGAKQKIWSIANQLISAKPTPQIKIGLISYRDRNDDYVTQITNLSADIDQVYAQLQKITADGGGDGPESVNQALREAVEKMNWSDSPDVLKIVFLVGDAPPHMDYPDDEKYPEICQKAVKKGLIINTVQCGNDPLTTEPWKNIANLAEGRFVAIAQTGDMEVVATPFDSEIAKTDAEMAKTVLAYGSRERKSKASARYEMAESMAAPVAADRAAFLSKSVSVADAATQDLVVDIAEGKVDSKAIPTEELPDELKGKSESEKKVIIEAKQQQRKQIEERMANLVKQRQEFIASEERKKAKEQPANSFDQQVYEIVKSQALKKGMKYE